MLMILLAVGTEHFNDLATLLWLEDFIYSERPYLSNIRIILFCSSVDI